MGNGPRNAQCLELCNGIVAFCSYESPAAAFYQAQVFAVFALLAQQIAQTFAARVRKKNSTKAKLERLDNQV